ncbi:MAG: hypothetical protein ABSA14_13465 [Acidimicrobiales bacterium]|jgi:hypothetical protein
MVPPLKPLTNVALKVTGGRADRVGAIAVIKPTAPATTLAAEYLSDDPPTAPPLDSHYIAIYRYTT